MNPSFFLPSTDGVEVAVYELGGSGPLVVLAHATGFCAAVWEPFAAHLADRYRCLALDFRAHGATRTPDSVRLDWKGMAQDLLRVVDAVGDGEPVRAIGHSMGGASIVLGEAARPGTFLRAWAYEPILFPRAGIPGAEEPPGIAVAARRRRPDFDSRADAVDRWASKPPLSLLDRRALEAYARCGLVDLPEGGVTLACRPEREAEVFEHHNTGAFDVLADVRFPLALATGGGQERPVQLVEQAAQAYPWIRLERYDDLSHFGPLQQPERLADAAAAWLG